MLSLLLFLVSCLLFPVLLSLLLVVVAVGLGREKWVRGFVEEGACMTVELRWVVVVCCFLFVVYCFVAVVLCCLLFGQRKGGSKGPWPKKTGAMSVDLRWGRGQVILLVLAGAACAAVVGLGREKWVKGFVEEREGA